MKYFQNENINDVDILITVYIMLNIFIIIHDTEEGNCSTILENLIDKMIHIIGSKNIYISHIFNIVTYFIDYHNFYELGYCINIINDPANLYNKEHLKKQLYAYRKMNMFHKINKIYDTINIFDNLLRYYGFNIDSNIDSGFIHDTNYDIDYNSESQSNTKVQNLDYYDGDLNMVIDTIDVILNNINRSKKNITQVTNNVDMDNVIDINNADIINKNLLNESNTNLFNILFIDENFDDIDDIDDDINDKTINNTSVLNNDFYTHKSKQVNNLRKFKLSQYDIYHINRSLSNLRYPTKLENYDLIRNLLCDTNLYTKSGEKITIYDNNHKTIAVVYPMKNATDNFTSNKISSKKRPTQWIKSYAPNICGEGKRDAYHMFPFVLDWLLQKWSCVEKNSMDKINPGKRIYYYYFYGEIIINGQIIKGCFEYFINNNGSLFHRLFKEIDRVPQKIINEIFN